MTAGVGRGGATATARDHDGGRGARQGDDDGAATTTAGAGRGEATATAGRDAATTRRDASMAASGSGGGATAARPLRGGKGTGAVRRGYGDGAGTATARARASRGDGAVTIAAKALVPLVLVPLLSLLPFSVALQVQDICPADLTQRDTPAGYPCKAPSDITVADFYYTGLATAGAEQAPFTYSLNLALVTNLTGLNGLGLSASRTDIPPGGAVPLHTHPEGSETFVVANGTVNVGFVTAATNTLYTKTLQKGQMFVFPRALLHFQDNAGDLPAVAYSAYSSSNPGAQIVDIALFGTNMHAVGRPGDDLLA
ncbi:hypothetical protein ACP4OV_017791 [Aristida adscensionis]